MKSELSYQVNDSFAKERVFTVTISEYATNTAKKPSKAKRQDLNSTKENFMRYELFYKSLANEIEPSEQRILLHQPPTCTYYIFYIDTNLTE